MTFWTTNGVGAVTAGESYTIMRPKYPPAAAKAGVIYCHGNGEASQGCLVWPGPEEVVRALAKDGHTVLSCDLGGVSTWGNDTLISRITDAKTYLLGTLGAKPGNVVLVGTSMGCLASLAWAAANPTLVACFVGMLPVVNLTDIWTNNRGGYTASINTAYGGAYSEATYGATHNPQTMASAGKYAGIPMRLFYGDSDTTVIPSTVTTFASTVGSNVTISTLSGGHASSTTALTDPPTVVSFVNANS